MTLRMSLNGDCLPWVKTGKHLGNQLSSELNFSNSSPETRTGILCKRAILFDKTHQVLQQFGFYEPRLVLKLLSVYSTALYGSPLWQLSSKEHLKLNRSWNIAVKIIWNLPHPTHTRFLEELCPVPHLESVLHSRYIGFTENLLKSSKPPTRLLFDTIRCDLGSQTGQNLQFLFEKYSKASVKNLIGDKNQIKKAKVAPVSENEEWKLKLIEEVCLVQRGLLEAEFDEAMLQEILEFVCTS